MVHISHESEEQTERRLRRVIAATDIKVYDEFYVFEQVPLHVAGPEPDDRTLAWIRDDQVWSRLVPAPAETRAERFGLVRFHFPDVLDNSGFVGWLATHLKRRLGTGVFVVCGCNRAQGGIFDYLGFPAGLRAAVLAEITSLRSGAANSETPGT